MNLWPLKSFLMLYWGFILDPLKKYIKSAMVSSTDKLFQIDHLPSNDCSKIDWEMEFPKSRVAFNIVTFEI